MRLLGQAIQRGLDGFPAMEVSGCQLERPLRVAEQPDVGLDLLNADEEFADARGVFAGK